MEDQQRENTTPTNARPSRPSGSEIILLRRLSVHPHTQTGQQCLRTLLPHSKSRVMSLMAACWTEVREMASSCCWLAGARALL